MERDLRTIVSGTVIAGALLAATAALAHDPPYTGNFDRSRCTFSSTGSNPFMPLWPGLVVELEGDDEGTEVTTINTVTDDTELVDGVMTRVITEEESEDGELVEVSFNFFAQCRETGDVWYFGEDVDIYEGGVIVSHEGAWRAGENGALAGVFMLGSPMIGARFYQEQAPGVAEDRGEVIAVNENVTVPAGSFTGVLNVLDTNALSPGSPGDTKKYAPGIGVIVDEVLELTSYELPECVPDDITHCLQNGRFRVTVDWENFTGGEGEGHAILPSNESGEFWFFGPGNTELLVKVIDACAEATPRYWVFAAGLTNVGVTLTVEDTQAPGNFEHEYQNPVGTSFAPILDIDTFATCP
jgi:hypothetical protein